MREALADAATEVLIERGWASVTVVEVCKRAGATRGAFHHHYDALPELLADALSRLYATMRTRRPAKVADLCSLIDATWQAIGNPRFKAVLEAWLAMANDPDLRSEIGPVVAEFADLVNPASGSSTVLAGENQRVYYLMARETMLGLALGRAANRGQALRHERAVLQTLRQGARALDRNAAP